MKLKDLKNKASDYDASPEGKRTNKYILRVLINGIICVILSIIYTISNLIFVAKWYEYITPVILIAFGIIFIYKAFDIKIMNVNIFNYYEKHPDKKKKPSSKN